MDEHNNRLPDVQLDATAVPPIPTPPAPEVVIARTGLRARLGAMKAKKGLLAGIIAAAVVVIVGGGSALAYNLWYQNPQKIVTDGIVHLMSAKSMTYKAAFVTTNYDESKSEVLLDGALAGATGLLNMTLKTTTSGGSTTNVKGAAILDEKGDLYFKVGNIKDLTNGYKSFLPSSASTKLDALVAKVDDTWIKVNADDLKSVSEDAAKTQTCTKKAIDTFTKDKKANKELGDLYANNQFITIDKKLGSKDGSLGYALSSDDAKSESFMRGLKDTKLYKDLHDCDSSFTIDEDDIKDSANQNDANKTKVEVWVSRWTHQITKVSFENDSDSADATKSTLVFEPKVGAKARIETPAKSTTIKQLSKDIEAFMGDLQSSYMYGYDDSVYGSSSDTSYDSSSYDNYSYDDTTYRN